MYHYQFIHKPPYHQRRTFSKHLDISQHFIKKYKDYDMHDVTF